MIEYNESEQCFEIVAGDRADYLVQTTDGTMVYSGVENFQQLWDEASRNAPEDFAILEVYRQDGSTVDLKTW